MKGRTIPLVALAAAALAIAAPPAFAQTGGFQLTLLHANDAESQLRDAGTTGVLPDYGGAHRFATVVEQLEDQALAAGAVEQAGLAARMQQREAACVQTHQQATQDAGRELQQALGQLPQITKPKKNTKKAKRRARRLREQREQAVAAAEAAHQTAIQAANTALNTCRDQARRVNAAEARGFGTALISSGDNILPGPELTASERRGVPFYDSIAMRLIGFDASVIGNHEFDLGPDFLSDFIVGTENVKWLSSNLDFTAEPALQALVDQGQIAKSTILVKGGERIGVVGATTEELPNISSPGDVVVGDVADAVQDEIDALTAQGVNKIITTTHLQGIAAEQALIPQLRGVDIAITGGGSELLANPGTSLVPGDEATIDGPYPVTATGADGATVPLVTTFGDYRYVGRLNAKFDSGGRLTAFSGGPVRVSGAAPENVQGDPLVEALVVEPVDDFVDDLVNNVIATTEIVLQGERNPDSRSRETNLGNLLADAIVWEADRRNEEFGAPQPEVGLQNGGGIRSTADIPIGNFTEFNTFDIASFFNLVAIVPNVTPQKLKEIAEHGVSLPFPNGRFAQISGFSFTYDLTGTAQVTDTSGVVTTPGTRVQDLTVDLDADGTPETPFYVDGVLQGGATNVDLATIDFLPRGPNPGDSYPFAGTDPFTILGSTYQQALYNYVSSPTGLNGTISAAEYSQPDTPPRISVDP